MRLASEKDLLLGADSRFVGRLLEAVPPRPAAGLGQHRPLAASPVHDVLGLLSKYQFQYR